MGQFSTLDRYKIYTNQTLYLLLTQYRST